MLFAFRFHREAFDERGQLFARDIRINPVAERLFFPVVTLDTYSHVLPGVNDGLAATMDEVLG